MFRQIMSGARVMMVVLAINACSVLVSALKRRPRTPKAFDIEARILMPALSDSTEDTRILPGSTHHRGWVQHLAERRELLGGD